MGVERLSVLIPPLVYQIQRSYNFDTSLEAIPPSVSTSQGLLPNDLASFLLNLTSVRQFHLHLFQPFKGSIPSELSLTNSRLPKGSLHALLAGKFSNNLWLFGSSALCTLCNREFFNSSVSLKEFVPFSQPVHTLHGSVLC
jgi:hypothetical protein